MPPSTVSTPAARVRLSSIGSGLFLSDDDIVVTPSPKNADQTKIRTLSTETTLSETSHTTTEAVPCLGGEPPLLDIQVEERGVQDLWHALSDAERAEISFDETMCIRFFRAHKGNTVKALEGLRHTLQWRREFGVDDIVATNLDSDEEMATILKRENETGKVYVRGFDAQGRAFLYMRPSRENTKHELNNMRHLVWNLEKAIAVTRLQSRRISGGKKELSKVNLMIDYEGFKLKDSPPLSTSRYTLDILQKHYPETMARAYILNPPLVFKTFWMIVRPFVDPTTKQKIVFCVSNRSGMIQLHDSCEGDLTKIEPVADGKATRDFDTKEYMRLQFSTSFDE